MNESILRAKIKLWQDQLLDLGKRNKMISFRQTRRSTLHLVSPSFEQLYQKIVVEEKELTFQRPIDRETDARTYALLSLLEQMNTPMEVTIGDIRADGALTETVRTLRNLRAKARLAMNEQGTNILYLLFGYIQWREKGNKGDTLCSPLLLVPVTLQLPQLNGPFSIKKHEDEVVVNPTLAYLFERDYGIRLPEFDAEKDSLEEFLTKMEEIAAARGWSIVRECDVALVSFLKISMYNDLIRNEAQLLSHNVIRAFAGEENSVSCPNIPAAIFDHDSTKAADSFQVLKADSSQMDAIALSRMGCSFVLEGPPGSGKSQTIANIIAQALADGKKILFVSEKMAALEVVANRLEDVHLSDFCLSLHSHKANKREILEQLGSNLRLQFRKVKDDEIAKLARLDHVRQQLRLYAEKIHEPLPGINRSLYELYGEIAKAETLPDIELTIPNISDMTVSDANVLTQHLAEYERAQNALGLQWYDHPWKNVTISYPSPSQLRQIAQQLQSGLQLLSDLENCTIEDSNLAKELTLTNLDEFHRLYQQAVACGHIPAEWFSRNVHPEEASLQTLKQRFTSVEDLRNLLRKNHRDGFFSINAPELRQALEKAISQCKPFFPITASDAVIYQEISSVYPEITQLSDQLQQLSSLANAFQDAYGISNSENLENLDFLLSFQECLQYGPIPAQFLNDSYLAEATKEMEHLNRQRKALADAKSQISSQYSSGLWDTNRLQNLLEELNAFAENSGYPDIANSLVLGTTPDEKLALLEIASHAFENRSCECLPCPKSFAEAKRQRELLRNLQEMLPLPQWNTPQDRQNAKSMLEQMTQWISASAQEQKTIDAFLHRWGIRLSSQTITADQAKQLLDLTDSTVCKIAQLYTNPNVWHCLEELEKHQSLLQDAINRVKSSRTQYHISGSVSNARLLELLQKYAELLPTIAELKTLAADANAENKLTQAEAAAQELNKLRTQLLQDFKPNVLALDYLSMKKRFETEYVGFWKHIRPSYQEDLHTVRALYKVEPKRLTDDDILSLLQTLQRYSDLMQDYTRQTIAIAPKIGLSIMTMSYDWDLLIRRLQGYKDLRACFKTNEDLDSFLANADMQSLSTDLSAISTEIAWFAEQKQPIEWFGTQYRRQNTDIIGLRHQLQLAQDFSDLFACSADHRFFLSCIGEQGVDESLRLALQNLVERIAWYQTQGDALHRYADLDADASEFMVAYQVKKLDAYAALAEEFGDATLSQVITNWNDDPGSIITYCSQLDELLLAEKVETFALPDFNAIQAIPAIYGLLRILRKIEAAIPGFHGKVPLSKLKEDQRKILDLSDEEDALTASEQSVARKLSLPIGSANGNLTHWEKTIALCRKLLLQYKGNIPAKLSQALLEGRALFSDGALLHHRQTVDSARKLDANYPGIHALPTLAQKVALLQTMIETIGNAVSLKNQADVHSLSPVSYDQMLLDLQSLSALSTADKVFQEELAYQHQKMPFLNLPKTFASGEAFTVFDRIRALRRDLSLSSLGTNLSRYLTAGMPNCYADTYEAQIEALMESRDGLKQFTELFSHHAQLQTMSLQELKQHMERCLQTLNALNSCIDLRIFRENCQRHGLSDFLDAVENANYPEGTLTDVFMKSFYYAWFEYACSQIPEIGGFRATQHEDRIATFRELDAHQLPVDQMRIRQKLISAMPKEQTFGRAADEMSILQHELGKKRNIMPLRRLFRSIPNLLLRLKPCLMMSPLSVAYFLEAETYQFDMVIFDEASQIFPQDAIGAISRGKQVIITGDSKQLPPTSFFVASTNNPVDGDSEDEYTDDVVYDSILEEASGCLPSHSLLWHYRSRYEDLISFSNRQIYQNSLITFPSNATGLADTGVEYVYVEDGVFENRRNLQEADRIVSLIHSHIQNHPERSLGVIAFSENQQSAIEEALEEFRLRHPELEGFFDENRENPFFVKNLENVQGDERDTILFSIGYGKNARGRMYLRFGPLGHPGGERRLNVAITRAKFNVKLVGSILPEDIPLDSIHSEGVRMLRSYIQFAMHRPSTVNAAEKQFDQPDGFKEMVADYLKEQGYIVHTDLGSSDYTIDIAVEHPDLPGQYLAGIECDGPVYRNARTVRDRDSLRAGVLEQMGWNMYRVWSTEWIRDPMGAQRRLLDFVQNCLIQFGQQAQEEEIESTIDVNTESASGPSTLTHYDPNNPYGFQRYKLGDWTTIPRGRANGQALLAQRILSVVKTEQPIHLDLLYRRLAGALGASKVIPSVREAIDEAIRKPLRNQIQVRDGFAYLLPQSPVIVRYSPLGAPDRTMDQISIPEIAAAMEQILSGAIGMDRNILIQETAKIFGFERLGPRIRNRANEAIAHLEHRGRIAIRDEKVQLLEEHHV